MKWMKQLLIASVFLGALLSLHGQSRIKFNVHADPQFAWFSSDEDNVVPDGSILHIQTGLQMDFFFDENYAFAFGFGINNMGGNLLYTDSTAFYSNDDTIYVNPGQTVKHNLQYLDIPLGIKLKTEELGYATFFLEVGFNPMINLNAKASSTDDTLSKKNIRESINIFNLGYHAGIGVEYRLGGSTAAIGGIRWSSGLTDVTDNDRANITMNAISIHIGVLF